jgi:hypothetical protein
MTRLIFELRATSVIGAVVNRNDRHRLAATSRVTWPLPGGGSRALTAWQWRWGLESVSGTGQWQLSRIAHPRAATEHPGLGLGSGD